MSSEQYACNFCLAIITIFYSWQVTFYPYFYCWVWLAVSVVLVNRADVDVVKHPLQGSQQSLHLPSPARNVFKMNFNNNSTISFMMPPLSLSSQLVEAEPCRARLAHCCQSSHPSATKSALPRLSWTHLLLCHTSQSTLSSLTSWWSRLQLWLPSLLSAQQKASTSVSTVSSFFASLFLCCNYPVAADFVVFSSAAFSFVESPSDKAFRALFCTNALLAISPPTHRLHAVWYLCLSFFRHVVLLYPTPLPSLPQLRHLPLCLVRVGMPKEVHVPSTVDWWVLAWSQEYELSCWPVVVLANLFQLS